MFFFLHSLNNQLVSVAMSYFILIQHARQATYRDTHVRQAMYLPLTRRAAGGLPRTGSTAICPTTHGDHDRWGSVHWEYDRVLFFVISEGFLLFTRPIRDSIIHTIIYLTTFNAYDILTIIKVTKLRDKYFFSFL